MTLAVFAEKGACGRVVGPETLLTSGGVATGFVHRGVKSRINSFLDDTAGAFLPKPASWVGVRSRQGDASSAEGEGRRESNRGFDQHFALPCWVVNSPLNVMLFNGGHAPDNCWRGLQR
jgi:hypothetical protein